MAVMKIGGKSNHISCCATLKKCDEIVNVVKQAKETWPAGMSLKAMRKATDEAVEDYLEGEEGT